MYIIFDVIMFLILVIGIYILSRIVILYEDHILYYQKVVIDNYLFPLGYVKAAGKLEREKLENLTEIQKYILNELPFWGKFQDHGKSISDIGFDLNYKFSEKIIKNELEQLEENGMVLHKNCLFLLFFRKKVGYKVLGSSSYGGSEDLYEGSFDSLGKINLRCKSGNSMALILSSYWWGGRYFL